MTTSPRPRPARLLVYRDLAARGVHYSRPHLLRLEARGQFPRRLQITPARIGWLESEIDEWILARAAERPGMRNSTFDPGDAPAPLAAAPRER